MPIVSMPLLFSWIFPVVSEMESFILSTIPLLSSCAQVATSSTDFLARYLVLSAEWWASSLAVCLPSRPAWATFPAAIYIRAKSVDNYRIRLQQYKKYFRNILCSALWPAEDDISLIVSVIDLLNTCLNCDIIWKLNTIVKRTVIVTQNAKE